MICASLKNALNKYIVSTYILTLTWELQINNENLLSSHFDMKYFGEITFIWKENIKYVMIFFLSSHIIWNRIVKCLATTMWENCDK